MLDALLFSRTPKLLTTLYPECLWKVDTKKKVLYLTFDDGPIPEITPFVLDELKKYKAKATFFCIGRNIEANPELFKRIQTEGHSIGNHTYNHLSGWKHVNKKYFTDIGDCQEVLDRLNPKSGIRNPTLFRPPYGKLKPSQYKALKDRYRIVMWDILTMDYSPQISKQRVLNNVMKYATEGSIIVFHDSLKAKAKVEYALPKVLQHFSDKGYKFATID